MTTGSSAAPALTGFMVAPVAIWFMLAAGAMLRSGSGDDILLVRDSARDHVTCGKGQDIVRADRRDRLAGCERVRFG